MRSRAFHIVTQMINDFIYFGPRRDVRKLVIADNQFTK